MDQGELYGDPFYEDEPFYRVGMSVQEFHREQEYLNDNIELFMKGDYKPLWKQRQRRNRSERRNN